MGGISRLIQLTPFLAFVRLQMVSECVMFGDGKQAAREGFRVELASDREREFDSNGGIIVGE
jgi:hypothetical protein